MRVRDARELARQWVAEEASSLPGFVGAYLSGSMTALPEEAVLAATSDVDIKVVLDGANVAADPQKYLYHDAVLDVSWGSSEDYRSPEAVLGTYYTAVHFTHPCILADPSEHLATIQHVVAREYPRRVWVRRRAEHARAMVEDILAWLNPATPIQNQAFTLLLATAVASHVVLVADLRNPTIRTCLVAAREVLTSHGEAALHETLLGVLGSASMRRVQVAARFASCEDAFDLASVIRATPFPYASNISPYARPIAIEGGREMIVAGDHREAMLWVAAIHTWCQRVFDHDASDAVRSRFAAGYERLLMELGISTHEDLAVRSEQLRQLLPSLWNAAEGIIETNPAIRE